MFFYGLFVNGGDIYPNHDHPIPGMVLQVGGFASLSPGPAATDDPHGSTSQSGVAGLGAAGSGRLGDPGETTGGVASTGGWIF